MSIDPASILDREDMERERTPEELNAWWDGKNREFADSKEGHNYALLRNGLAKEFFEEIYPLTLLANILYSGRSDIKCIPNLGNDNFDAIIRDCSKSPNFDLKVEFTQAIDGHDENLRMEYLIEHGYVSPIGPLSFTGTKKTGHKISVEFEPVLHDDSLENNFTLIKNRAELKSKPKNYGKNYVLVIVIDDYIAPRFDNQNDLEALNEFILTNIISLPLDFARLYILGLSGETLLTYEIVEKDRIFRCHYPPETYENRNMKINERLRQKREEVLKLASQHGAFQVRVFGSVARGEDTAASDLDLLVEMEPERSLLDLVAIKQDLEDLLGCKVH